MPLACGSVAQMRSSAVRCAADAKMPSATALPTSAESLSDNDRALLMQLKRNHPLSIVVAMTQTRGIGYQNQLPWPHNPVDFRHFAHLTQFTGEEGRGGEESKSGRKRNAVIMGRRTWESLPAKARPLKSRINIVVSTTMSDSDVVGGCGDNTSEVVRVARSLPAALCLIEQEYDVETAKVFCIGGSNLYASALSLDLVDSMYITRVGMEFPVDVSFPSFRNVPEEELAVEKQPTGQQQAAADSGPWASLTSGFVVTYISKSHSAGGVPFDFVVMERQRGPRSIQGACDNSESVQRAGPAAEAPAVPAALAPLRAAEEAEKERMLKKARSDAGAPPECQREPVHVLPHVVGRHHEEFQYLDLICDIINTGIEQPDRTGVGIISKFGCQMRFSLHETFPLLTTKRVFWRGVVEELLWFIRADTNANHLSEKGVKIWDANATREFLDKRGLHHREQGDIGPVYGFQWRHFGAQYKTMHDDYTGQGVDQLSEVIRKLKEDPYDRRIIMSAWNPAALHEMALPPCHLLCQFYVANGSLSCSLYQRSCDVGLGVPFNIASYALLTIMLAKVCNLKPGEFVHFLGNTHVYKNHVEALKLQIKREPRPFPVLKIKGDPQTIEDFTLESFELVGYNPHGPIKMEMAV